MRVFTKSARSRWTFMGYVIPCFVDLNSVSISQFHTLRKCSWLNNLFWFRVYSVMNNMTFRTQIVEVWEWISNCIPHCTGHLITHPSGDHNSLKPRDAFMRHQTRPSLLQIMACRLFGAKPLTEPMYHCQLDLWEDIVYQNTTRKCAFKCRLRNGVHFVLASMCYV